MTKSKFLGSTGTHILSPNCGSQPIFSLLDETSNLTVSVRKPFKQPSKNSPFLLQEAKCINHQLGLNSFATLFCWFFFWA